MKIAVYTAITGGYELPKENQVWGDADWFFFGEGNPGGKWQKQKPTHQFVDERLNARFHKILPEFDHDFSIWIDGSVSLKITPEELVANIGDDNILVHKHPVRDCVYDEAEEILRLKLDYPWAVKKQIERLRKWNYPEHHGLAETKIVVRRTSMTQTFNKEWWWQLVTGSSRDQLSFNPAIYRSGGTPRMFDLLPIFDQVKHQRKVYS